MNKKPVYVRWVQCYFSFTVLSWLKTKTSIRDLGTAQLIPMLILTWSVELGTDFRAWEFHCWFSLKEAKRFHCELENYSGFGWGSWHGRMAGDGGVLNPKLDSDGLWRRIVWRLFDSFVDWIVLNFSNVDEKWYYFLNISI